MALSFSSAATKLVTPRLEPCTTKASSSITFPFQFNYKNNLSKTRLKRPPNIVLFCESACDDESTKKRRSKLVVGSPIIVVEAPKMIKTAASLPCLRVNSGLVKPGDVGRIVSRKPMDVWAIRLSIGTYLIDGKYFKPLELDE